MIFLSVLWKLLVLALFVGVFVGSLYCFDEEDDSKPWASLGYLIFAVISGCSALAWIIQCLAWSSKP